MKLEQKNTKEKISQKEIKFPKYNQLKTLSTIVKNLSSPKWERTERIKQLSNLLDEEIDELPPNNTVTKLFTAVMRAWQKDVRSHFIGISNNSDETRKTQIERLQRNNKQTPFVIYTPEEPSQEKPFSTTTNDFINPFDIKGNRIYGTEYAQLVNIAARVAKKNGIRLSNFDIFKLTLLASNQLPPGLSPKGMKIMPDSFIQGHRIENEIEEIKNINFLQLVPITQERINDIDFVKAIPFKLMVSNSSMKRAIREAIKGLSLGKI